MQDANPTPGTLTLMGSGEMSATMGKVHRAVMSRIADPVRAVFLDTPAGFQLNADQISAKAINYFQQRFDLALSVASFKSATTATPVEVENALRTLRLANYIFAGPGSPTYTVRHWRDTAILEAMARRLAAGAHLVLASAAAIAVGRYALPVYEIYKVGEEPRWVDGLDLLGPYGLELIVVPHWNNTEGNAHDTRYCFIGKPRLKLLEKQLPQSATILGIDEYTACILDIAAGKGRVMGAGQVTIRCRGCEAYHPAGTAFPLAQLAEQNGVFQPSAFPIAVDEGASRLPSAWDECPEMPDDDVTNVDDLLNMIVEVRARLRTAKQWTLADDIRQKLFELGIVLEDTPSETTWKRQ